MRQSAILFTLMALWACTGRPSGGGTTGGGTTGGTGAGTSASADGGTVDSGSVDSGSGPSGDGSGSGTGGGGVSGLAANAAKYFECGGSYYEDEDDFILQSAGYWGTCEPTKTALDTYSDCMAALDCDEYPTGSFNPNTGPCSDEYAALSELGPCE